jgi:hypothetical protein
MEARILGHNVGRIADRLSIMPMIQVQLEAMAVGSKGKFNDLAQNWVLYTHRVLHVQLFQGLQKGLETIGNFTPKCGI